jgi:predicted nucleic acid-binding protein
MKDSRIFLDSSAWIGYFQRENESLDEIIESPGNFLLTSAISFHEVPKKFLSKGKDPKDVKIVLSFMKERSLTIKIDAGIAEKSVADSRKNNLHAIDALIYRSALDNDATLVTMDYDFHKLPGVKIIKQA